MQIIRPRKHDHFAFFYKLKQLSVCVCVFIYGNIHHDMSTPSTAAPSPPRTVSTPDTHETTDIINSHHSPQHTCARKCVVLIQTALFARGLD